MKRMLLLFGLCWVLALTSGCMSMNAEQRNREVRRNAEMQNMKADIERLRSRLDGVASAQEQLYREFELLRTADSGVRKELESKLNDLSRDLQATDHARQALKSEIVDGLTEQISEVMKQRRPPAPNRQRGYEHVVETGQTLSAVAAAYGVSARAIADANGIDDPNKIRVGQTLFIPE